MHRTFWMFPLNECQLDCTLLVLYCTAAWLPASSIIHNLLADCYSYWIHLHMVIDAACMGVQCHTYTCVLCIILLQHYCGVMFLGYVDREAIGLMVVPDRLKEIEDFISDNFPGDKEYVGQIVKLPFKFLPAHAAKLKKFISEVKDDISARTLKNASDLPKAEKVSTNL